MPHHPTKECRQWLQLADGLLLPIMGNPAKPEYYYTHGIRLPPPPGEGTYIEINGTARVKKNANTIERPGPYPAIRVRRTRGRREDWGHSSPNNLHN